MTNKNWQSMKSCCRARTTDQRGYVLISAVALAILYFALMELMLIDSSRALREAQQFRSRIVASTLAESAAELASAQMVTRGISSTVNAQDEQGSMTGQLHLINDQFELIGDVPTKAANVHLSNLKETGVQPLPRTHRPPPLFGLLRVGGAPPG